MASGIQSVQFYIDYNGTIKSQADLRSNDILWENIPPNETDEGMVWSIGSSTTPVSSGKFSTKHASVPLGVGPGVLKGAEGYGYYAVYVKVTDFAGNITYYGPREMTGVTAQSSLQLKIIDDSLPECAFVDISDTKITELTRRITWKYTQSMSGITPYGCYVDIEFKGNNDQSYVKLINALQVAGSGVITPIYAGSTGKDYLNAAVSAYDATKLYSEIKVTFDILNFHNYLTSINKTGMADGSYKITIYAVSNDLEVAYNGKGPAYSDKVTKVFTVQTAAPELNVALISTRGNDNSPTGQDLFAENGSPYTERDKYFVLNNAKGVTNVVFSISAKDRTGATVGYLITAPGSDTPVDEEIATVGDQFEKEETYENPGYSITLPKDGTYQITIYAKDMFGRNTNYDTYKFEKDTKAPILNTAPVLGMYNDDKIKDDMLSSAFKITVTPEDK